MCRHHRFVFACLAYLLFSGFLCVCGVCVLPERTLPTEIGKESRKKSIIQDLKLSRLNPSSECCGLVGVATSAGQGLCVWVIV